MDQLINRAVAMLKAHEGVRAFMYADTNGIVTVGCGHALFSADDACRLRFFHRDGLPPASPADIAAEWARAKRIPIRPGDEGLASLFVPPQDIDMLLADDLARFARTLNAELPNYVALPDDAKLACLDIVFNTGSLRGWPKLRAAVVAGDWDAAALECLRPSLEPRGSPGTASAPHGQRNKDTRALFLACAAKEPSERTI